MRQESCTPYAAVPTLTCTLCLTQDCTLRCKYCYVGRKRAMRMSAATARRGLEISMQEAARSGSGMDVAFFGGEPLLEWELLQECCAYTRQLEQQYELPRPVRFGVTTNGTLLIPERVQYLQENDFLVGLSIDGSPAMHNANRCYADGRGSHAEVARALELLEARPHLRQKLICVVTPSNAHLLDEGVAWLAERYSGNISLNMDYWSDWTDATFEVLREQMQRVGVRVLASWRSGKPIRLLNLEDKIHYHVSGACSPTCRLGEKEITITTDGLFYPCSRLVGSAGAEALCFGNTQSGIDRAKQNYLIATRGNATPKCRVCDWRARCLNGCGCTNYAASGAINQVSPFLCQEQRLLIRTADAMAEALYAEKNAAFLKVFYAQAIPMHVSDK